MIVLGIDPGSSGAAAVVDGGSDKATTVMSAWAWTRTRRRAKPYDVAAMSWSGLPLLTWSEAELWAAMPQGLGVEVGYLLVLERPFVGRGAHASLRVAEQAGALLDRFGRGVPTLRPLAHNWRSALGVDKAGALALAQATASYPHDMHTEHLAEAVCMALYGLQRIAAGDVEGL